jgi:photosystem II stability/assembly factor-like uncharacterized protein
MKTINIFLIIALMVLSAIGTKAGYIHPPPSCTYSWATQSSGTTHNILSVCTVDENICWAAGSNGMVRKTIDGGLSWSSAASLFTDDIVNIFALDANTAFIASYNSAGSVIYRTTNGGGSWIFVLVQPGGFFNSITMKDANTGFVNGDPVGGRWSLWKTTNGGLNWDSTGLYLPRAGTEVGWNNSMSIVGNNIWFGTTNSRVYHSTNFGAAGSWTPGATVKNIDTYGVCFTNASTGLCVGKVVGKTTDGGATWIKKGQPGGTGNILAISGSGKFFWCIRGNNIYGSINFGRNWHGTGYTGSNTLYSIDVTGTGGNCKAGWAGGNSGLILRLTGIDTSAASRFTEEDYNIDLPEIYKLEQNYPNPFNPVTKIQFEIPRSGHVKLVVYDLLGREVASIVNEYLEAGYYSFDFDASGIASGVYIYKIEAGNFTDVKKMMVLK